MEKDIKLIINRRIDVREPVMLVAWPGMGNVALGSIDYIRKQLRAVKFAEIDVSAYFIPDRVIVEEGLTRFPRPPSNVFYYTKNPDILIFEGEEQVGGKAGIRLTDTILDLAQELGVKRLYAGAAFPMLIYHTDPSLVYGVATSPNLRDILLRNYGVRIMDDGQISGLNGLILNYARKRGIEACCLLATMPIYAVNIYNPKACKAIIQTFERILKIRVGFTELDLAIQEMERRMKLIEEQIRSLTPGEEIPRVTEEEEVPKYVLFKIERLFEEAKRDKKKAYELKRELDHWGLFKSYEDRFLDLFRREEL